MSLSVSRPTSSSLARASQSSWPTFSAKAAACSLLARSPGAKPKRAEHAAGYFVTFRMDPGGVERILALGDLEEAGRLHEGGVAEAGHALELFAAAEGAVLAAMLVHPPRRELVHARHVAQQGGAGGVHIDPHEVHARFDHLVEHGAEVLGLDVVLVEPHADVGGVDLDQFAERVLQAAADGNGAADRGVELGKFLAAHAAGGIHAGSRLVHNHVGDAAAGQLIADQVGDEIFRFAAAGAVAHDHHLQLVLGDQLDHLLHRFGAAVGLAHQVHHVVIEHVAELIQGHQFAAALETRIERQQAAIAHRRLEQQVAEIAGEHAYRVGFGLLGHLAAGFAIQAGKDQPHQGVAVQPRRKSPWGCSGGTTTSSSTLYRASRSASIFTRSTLARSPRFSASTRWGGMRRMSSR